MNPRLSLTVLIDNTTLTDCYFVGEPGLSFFLETAGKKILFDTGYRGCSSQMQRRWGLACMTWT